VTKSYLRELAAAGVAVTPTVWVPVGSTATLGQLADEIGAEAVVVKPNVSATAFETWRFDRARATDAEAQFARLVRERDLMVQPFLPAIETDGELSLVFLDGAFSHAVRKRPRPGDFRVQEEHGGTAEAAVAGADLVRQAARALAVAPGDPLYARVDGLASDGTFVVTELELVEPMLYFGWDAGAADRMAEALLRRLGGG
jgi:glutathione synthase/RimK-type ligase-like ATP-grasp enzyme